MKYNKPITIAEIGCNHKGDFEIAKKMITIAKNFCNVDVVKFQKRDNKKLLSEKEYNSKHPNQKNSYGDTYGKHREFLEFDIEQHKKLMDFCYEIGIIYSTSVWDINSAKEIVSLKPSFIKIPSAQNNNVELLEYLLSNYDGQIHISLGMTTFGEIERLYNFINSFYRLNDVVIYSCVSGYPVSFNNICLLEINRIKEYGFTKIGFSGHHLGIAPDIAAYTLGAEYIERHFTLDRTWKGTDHAASLEPDGLRKLNRNLLAVHESLTYKSNDGLLEVERKQRLKLKYKRNVKEFKRWI